MTDAPANPGTPDTGAAASEPTPAKARTLAPIPPAKAAKAGGSEEARPRNADGTFASTGEREDDGGLPDILKDTGGVEDEHDRAKTTLDGGEPERIKPLAHKTTKARAKDVLAPKPEGAATATDASAGDGVAPLPEGAQPPEEGGPEGEPAAEPLEIKGKLVIAGTEYRDIAHLEQSIKSLRGMYVSEVKSRTQAKDVAKQNYNAAIAWQGRASAAEARLAQLEGTASPSDSSSAGAPSTGSTPAGASGATAVATQVAKATGDTAENILKSIDWDRYKKIRETHDAETALVWVMEQSLTKIQQRYDARLDEMTRPAAEQSALMEQGGKIGDQMDVMRDWTYEGSVDPIYPELADADAYEEIAQVVVAMHGKGLPLKFFETPEGINQAILTWRDWRSRTKRPWSATSSTVTAPDAHDVAAASVRAAAAGGPGALTGRSAPLRPAPAETGRGAEIVRGITETGKPTEFGWAR